MKILGLDPGLRITGYGVISTTNIGGSASGGESCGKNFKLIEAGVIRTALKDKIAQRLTFLHKELLGLIDEVKPEICILENLYSHYKHPRTSILMGHARGAILLACAQRGLPIVDYSAKRVRKAVLGNGNASKEQIQRMVQSILGLKSVPSPNDVSDALALAIAHVYMDKIK
ncbi:MAG: crossover junction endodeoxyribonuclease RuvC [Candidatus Omnitrophota bacterium]